MRGTLLKSPDGEMIGALGALGDTVLRDVDIADSTLSGCGRLQVYTIRSRTMRRASDSGLSTMSGRFRLWRQHHNGLGRRPLQPKGFLRWAFKVSIYLDHR
jgi:hypothetical protein